MSKARIMGAGSAGSTIYNANVNLNTAGGTKKQGLPFGVDGRSYQGQNRRVQLIKAVGDKRDWIFTTNQLNRLGGRRSHRAVIDGVHKIPPYKF
jgi:hypothetical protein